MQLLPTPMLATLLAAPLLLAPLAALAEDQAPVPALPAADASGAGRFTMVPADGGFVRLDTETGQVAQCRRDGNIAGSDWRCTLIPETASPADPRGDTVAARIDALAAAVADLARRVGALESHAAATGTPALERARGVGAEGLRRLFALTREWKGGLDRPEPPEAAVTPLTP